jgi:hypothetical protein
MSSVPMRFRFIEDHRGTWPVPVMGDVFHVAASGDSAWHSRPESQCAAENRALLDSIRQCMRPVRDAMAAGACLQRCGRTADRWAGAGSNA